MDSPSTCATIAAKLLALLFARIPLITPTPNVTLSNLVKESSRTEEKSNMQTGTMLTRSRRPVVFLTLLLVVLTALAGCGPRATGGDVAATADESQIAIDLPALVIDVQPDGSLSIGGQPVAQLGAMAGQDLSTLIIPADTVDFLTAANIQHIQVDNTADGLLILVNGQAMPSLAWDGEKLVATGEVLETLGGGLALLDKLLPMVRSLGLGVTMRFPIAQGAEVLPMVVVDDQIAATARAAQQEFLDAVGTPPTFAATVTYMADGSWSVAGLSQAELAQYLPAVQNYLSLSPSLIQSASAAGIDKLTISTNTDGIFIAVNGKTLPYITWADGRINHILTLVQQTGLLGEGLDAQTLINTVEGLLPAVQASNLTLSVDFP